MISPSIAKGVQLKKRINIGTSGWHYEHWKGPFYPERIPNGKLLEFYSARFDTVEVNNSFYRLPDEKTLIQWRDTAPEGFIFSIKASRLITHMKKLKDPAKTLPPLLERIEALKDKLGPILFQMPPRWGLDIERLGEFLNALPKKHRYTFEFRDASWFDERVYEKLFRRNIAFCMYDFNRVLSPREITADFIYIRLHGPAGKYAGQYSDEALAQWAGYFSRWIRDVKEIYCYFDNDEAGYAAKDALRLKEMVKSLPLAA